MNIGHLENDIKNELNRLDKKIRNAEILQSVAWIGSIFSAAVVLLSVGDHIPMIAGIAACGALLDVAARRFVSRKK